MQVRRVFHAVWHSQFVNLAGEAEFREPGLDARKELFGPQIRLAVRCLLFAYVDRVEVRDVFDL